MPVLPAVAVHVAVQVVPVLVVPVQAVSVSVQVVVWSDGVHPHPTASHEPQARHSVAALWSSSAVPPAQSTQLTWLAASAYVPISHGTQTCRVVGCGAPARELSTCPAGHWAHSVAGSYTMLFGFTREPMDTVPTAHSAHPSLPDEDAVRALPAGHIVHTICPAGPGVMPLASVPEI